MATANGVVPGKNIIFSVDGVAVGCSKDAKITMDRAVLEASCKESAGTKEVTLGNFSWEMSTENIYKIGSAVNLITLFNLLKNGTKVNVSWGTNLTGDQIFTGQAYCNKLDASGPVADNAGFSASFTGTGDLILSTLASPY